MLKSEIARKTGSRMLRTMMILEGEDVTKDEGGELGTVRSISETLYTAPCATFVDP
jgi:hypothetical protein